MYSRYGTVVPVGRYPVPRYLPTPVDT